MKGPKIFAWGISVLKWNFSCLNLNHPSHQAHDRRLLSLSFLPREGHYIDRAVLFHLTIEPVGNLVEYPLICSAVRIYASHLTFGWYKSIIGTPSPAITEMPAFFACLVNNFPKPGYSPSSFGPHEGCTVGMIVH